ncbi:unnamed protein product [Toxocara canis]|uniref:Reverse transcriptase domain-containing protein n=1 Tax=Toxocara canis TaxID=6265 RepID=A0A183VBA8_TOXCA|nr:unnamed protein product [Toxocara canis]
MNELPGQPHVNEEKENVKKTAVVPKRQIVNQNGIPSRRTAQHRGTISGAPLVESGSYGATASFNPNVNSDICRWTTSCAALIKTASPRGITPGICTARFRTKAAGYTTGKPTPTDAGLISQMGTQLIRLSSDGTFVNDAPLESPLITADDEKHDSLSEKFDQNTYDYYVPKIIADYLEVGCLP